MRIELNPYNMEEIIKSLAVALQSLREWQSADQRKDQLITELKAENTRLAQAALPQVSVTGKPVFNPVTNMLDVEWMVTPSTDQPLKVNVMHSQTTDGYARAFVWDVKGVTKGQYAYPVATLRTDMVGFTILPGEGYSVAGEPVSFKVADYLPSAQHTPAPVPGVYTPEQGAAAAKPQPIQLPNVNFNKPFLITKGGTYKGDWESKDTEIPAVEVRTQEPVIIENSTIAGAGYLIKHWAGNANLIVRNTLGIGLTPTAWKDYKKPRRFLVVAGFKSILVEDCELLGTAGVLLGGSYQGNGTAAETFRIRFNRARNIDGRILGGKDLVQFFQTNFRGAIPHAEVCWNEIVNEPGNSAVEDNINIYNTRGTAASPIRIHHNYIEGAYPIPATATAYTGGGIIMDSPNATAEQATAFVSVEDNHLVGLGNYCIGVATANNINIRRNRCIVSSEYDNGQKYPFWTSGIWAKDYYVKGATHTVLVEQNTAGVKQNSGRRWDYENIGGVATFRENESLPDVTKADEAKEYALWQKARTQVKR